MSNDSPDANAGGKSFAEQMLDLLFLEDTELSGLIENPSTKALIALPADLSVIALSFFISRTDCSYITHVSPTDRGETTARYVNTRHGKSEQLEPPKSTLVIVSPKTQICQIMRDGGEIEIIMNALSGAEADPKKELIAKLQKRWSAVSDDLEDCDGSSATTPKKLKKVSSSPYSGDAIIKGFYAVVSAILVGNNEHLPSKSYKFVTTMMKRFKKNEEAAKELRRMKTIYRVDFEPLTQNGNFGDVHKATRRSDGEAVCIKMPRLSSYQTTKDVKNEESMAKCMSSPFFANLLDSGGGGWPRPVPGVRVSSGWRARRVCRNRASRAAAGGLAEASRYSGLCPPPA